MLSLPIPNLAHRLCAFLKVAAFAAFSTAALAAEAPVNLGAADSYVALAATTLTNVASVGTVIVGDVGVSPGSAITGFPPGIVTGSINAGNAAAAQAHADAAIAYLDLSLRNNAPIGVSGNLGGSTLFPGLYKSTGSLAVSSGNLTLDAQGDPTAVWIFQMASTFTMTSGLQIILAGGAQAGNVYWQVGSSATFGTTTVVKGTIIADQAITFMTGASLEGRALAINAAVTLDSNAGTKPIVVVFSPTPTSSPTPSPSATATTTGTPSPTGTTTPTPSATSSPTSSGTETATPSPSATTAATASATGTPTSTAALTATLTTTPTSSFTPAGTSTPTPSQSATAAATASSTETPTPAPTATSGATPTESVTASPSSTPTPSTSPTSTANLSPTPTNSPTSTAAATATPDATATATTAATSSPTPTTPPTSTPAPTAECVSFEFTNSAEGWTSHSLAQFTAPTFIYEGTTSGTLRMRATNNDSTFGFWESPGFELVVAPSLAKRGSIPLAVPALDGTTVFAASFTLIGTTTTRDLMPEIRLRTTAENSQQADVAVLSSRGSGGVSPFFGNASTQTLFFMPAAGSPSFRMQFDLLNFTPGDAPTAAIGLDAVSICPVDLATAVTETVITFDTDREGWVPNRTDGFQVPKFFYDPAAGWVTLQAVPSGDEFQFGFWASRVTEPLVHPVADRLYFAEFTVGSDEIDASRVPSFRVRINESGFRAAQYLQVASNGTSFNSPTLGNPKTYTVFFPPNVATDGAYLMYSFDILTEDASGDSTSTTLSLTEVRVRSVALPGAAAAAGAGARQASR